MTISTLSPTTCVSITTCLISGQWSSRMHISKSHSAFWTSIFSKSIVPGFSSSNTALSVRIGHLILTATMLSSTIRRVASWLSFPSERFSNALRWSPFLCSNTHKKRIPMSSSDRNKIWPNFQLSVEKVVSKNLT